MRASRVRGGARGERSDLAWVGVRGERPRMGVVRERPRVGGVREERPRVGGVRGERPRVGGVKGERPRVRGVTAINLQPKWLRTSESMRATSPMRECVYMTERSYTLSQNGYGSPSSDARKSDDVMCVYDR